MIITIPLLRDSKVAPKASTPRAIKDKVERKPRKRCRTGCITCRIRRVKCDEAKPSCVRCTSTGRKCDGYQVEAPSKSDSSIPTSRTIIIRKSSSDDSEVKPGVSLENITRTSLNNQNVSILHVPSSAVNIREQRSLEYYCRRTAANLSGYFESTFWSSVVLQLSSVEPSIRHGLLALSSLHEGVEIGGDINVNNQLNRQHQHFALQQYSAAVAQIRHLLENNSKQTPEITLTACLIFTCHELMQYNYNMAIKHLLAGLTLLASEEGSEISQTLRDMFSQVMMQSVFLGAPYIELRYIPKQPLRERLGFSSISDARDALQERFVYIYPFLWETANNAIQPDEISKKYKSLTQEVHNWYNLFQKFIAQQRHTFTPKDSMGTTLLYVHYICLTIILATAPGPAYTSFAAMTPCFIRIVSIIDGILGPVDASSSPGIQQRLPHLPNFSLDNGLLAPLFYTAIKCRSSPVRWEAISLLKHPRVPHREGIWGAPMTARMAQRVVELEEQMALEKGLGSSEFDYRSLSTMEEEPQYIADKPPPEQKSDTAPFWDIQWVHGDGKALEGAHDKICLGEGVDLEWQSRHPVTMPEERVLRLFIGGRGEERERWREEIVTW